MMLGVAIFIATVINHLVSPLVAAATAVRGTLSSPADLEGALVSATSREA